MQVGREMNPWYQICRDKNCIKLAGAAAVTGKYTTICTRLANNSQILFRMWTGMERSSTTLAARLPGSVLTPRFHSPLLSWPLY